MITVRELVAILTADDVNPDALVLMDGYDRTGPVEGIDYADGNVVIAHGFATRRPPEPKLKASELLVLQRVNTYHDLENCIPGVGELLRDRIMALLDEYNLT